MLTCKKVSGKVFEFKAPKTRKKLWVTDKINIKRIGNFKNV